MIEDINRTPDPQSMNLMWAESAGRSVVFSAYSPKAGQELWAVGPRLKPRLLKDIQPGPLGSSPSLPMTMADAVYFSADDGTHGEELWRSDGTTKGTRMVADLTPGPASTAPGTYHASAGHLFFSPIPKFGQELWATDGTAAGTVLLNPPAGGLEGPRRFEHFSSLCSIGDTTWFLTQSDVQNEIWRSDGTFAGTQSIQVLDDDVGFISDMAAAGENLFLLTYHSTELEDYQELWVMNNAGGAPAPVAPAASSPRWVNVSPPITLGDRVILSVANSLWVSDGTSAGTRSLPMVHHGIERQSAGSLVTWQGHAYLFAQDEAGSTELWRTDGTAAGTMLVRQGMSSGGAWSMLPVGGTEGPHLALDVRQSEFESILWATDGSTAGTRPLTSSAPIHLSYGSFSGFAGDHLFFIAAEDIDSERRLWRTDGTAAGTRPYREKSYPSTESATLQAAPIPLGDGRVIFAPTVKDDEKELWVSNGTAKGTRPIWVPPASTANAGGILPRAALGGEVIFVVTTTEGTQLWITDGSGGGTRMLRDFAAGDFGYPAEFLTVGESTFFVTGNATRRFLWRTDGTVAGTTELPGANGESLIPVAQAIAEFQGRLYFLAGTANGNAKGLWESDGTPEGTKLVREIDGLGIQGKLEMFTKAGGRLYFTVVNGVDQVLWTSDGTSEGTLPLEAFWGELRAPADMGSFFAFVFREWGKDDVWYRSDGTTHGTVPFATLPENSEFPKTNPSFPLHAAAGGILYYLVITEDGDDELWKSNGTAAGTMRLKDIQPGTQGSHPRNLRVIDGVLYFTADDGVHGEELWQSDGTEAGTRMVADLQRGPLGSSPGYITAIGSKLYVHATQQRFGAELHVIDLPKKRRAR